MERAYWNDYLNKNGAKSNYVNHGNLKGIPNQKKSPSAVKLKLIDTTIKIIKREISSPSQIEKLTTLIWDISVASYEHGKGE